MSKPDEDKEQSWVKNINVCVRDIIRRIDCKFQKTHGISLWYALKDRIVNSCLTIPLTFCIHIYKCNFTNL